MERRSPLEEYQKKIKEKLNTVRSYDEVKKDEIPKKAMSKLEK